MTLRSLGILRPKDVPPIEVELVEVPQPSNARSQARTDFLVPPSLRLGLIDVVAQIGGDEAMGILAETLDTTGRGVEVAHIARILQADAPGRYREASLKAAKDLLSNPVPAGSPNRIDENARAYLYQVLALHQDTSFATAAQGQLVSAEGRVDKRAGESQEPEKTSDLPG